MIESHPIILGCAIFALGIIGSALCSGLETGFYCVSRVRLRLRTSQGDARAAAVRHELDEPDRLLTTLLIWNNVFGYLASLGLTFVLLALAVPEVWVIVLQAVVLTPMLLVLAESLPKEVFRMRADAWPYRLVRVVQVLRWVSLPVLWLVLGLARVVARLVGAGDQARPNRRDQIASLLKEGMLHGAISSVQASLIDQALGLANTAVGDVMQPLARFACVGVNPDDRQLRAAARRAGPRPIVVLDGHGRVLALLDPLDALRGDWPQQEPVRLDARLGARDALARMSAEGARAAVIVRGGRDIGIVTSRQLVRPLVESLRGSTE